MGDPLFQLRCSISEVRDNIGIDRIKQGDSPATHALELVMWVDSAQEQYRGERKIEKLADKFCRCIELK